MEKENFLKDLRKHNPKALDYVFDNYGNLIFKVHIQFLIIEVLVKNVLMMFFLKYGKILIH